MKNSRYDWQTTLVLRGAADQWLTQSGAVSALPDAPVVDDRPRWLARLRLALLARRRGVSSRTGGVSVQAPRPSGGYSPYGRVIE
jgi:hypothetical protein